MNKIYKRWFTIRSISQSTQEIYRVNFEQFLKSVGYSIENLYDISKTEDRDNVREEEQTLYNIILDYKFELDNSEYAETTKKLKLQTIYSFCRAFGFSRPNIRQTKVVCEDKNYERPLKKRELRLMMNASGLRERAFISIQSQSGMGSQEVRSLTVRKIIEVVNAELDTNYHSVEELLKNFENIIGAEVVYEVKIVRKKVNYRYITFFPVETMKHILEYISFRHNEKGKKQIVTVDDYLFVTKTGRYMSSKTVTAMYREIGVKCGFKSEENTYRFWRSHNVRKYFYNIVEEIVGSEYADEFLGHVPSKTTQAYARRDSRMRKAYVKCLPFLNFESMEVANLQEKIQKLESELKILKNEVE